MSIWRVAVAVAGSKRWTDYRNVEAETAEDAEQAALKLPRVIAVKWVARPDPTRTRS